MLNMCSVESDGHDFVAQQILRYFAFTMSVLSEYLVGESNRIRRAAFSGIRLLLQHGLATKFFKPEPEKANEKKKSKGNDILELLKFNELTLNEEVKNMRKNTGKVISGKDKLVIHMLYLLTSRFSQEYELVLKLVQTFIEKVGSEIDAQQCSEFLLIVSQLGIEK